MAKKPNISLPSGQGGLFGGATSSLQTKIMFSPKFVIYFSIAVVVFIWILFNSKAFQ